MAGLTPGQTDKKNTRGWYTLTRSARVALQTDRKVSKAGQCHTRHAHMRVYTKKKKHVRADTKLIATDTPSFTFEKV